LEAENLRRTDNTIGKRKKEKERTMIYKSMNKKLQNEQHELTKNLELTNALQKGTLFLLQKSNQLFALER
jgi:hypothetical protein